MLQLHEVSFSKSNQDLSKEHSQFLLFFKALMGERVGWGFSARLLPSLSSLFFKCVVKNLRIVQLSKEARIDVYFKDFQEVFTIRENGRPMVYVRGKREFYTFADKATLCVGCHGFEVVLLFRLSVQSEKLCYWTW